MLSTLPNPTSSPSARHLPMDKVRPALIAWAHRLVQQKPQGPCLPLLAPSQDCSLSAATATQPHNAGNTLSQLGLPNAASAQLPIAAISSISPMLPVQSLQPSAASLMQPQATTLANTTAIVAPVTSSRYGVTSSCNPARCPSANTTSRLVLLKQERWHDNCTSVG